MSHRLDRAKKGLLVILRRAMLNKLTRCLVILLVLAIIALIVLYILKGQNVIWFELFFFRPGSPSFEKIILLTMLWLLQLILQKVIISNVSTFKSKSLKDGVFTSRVCHDSWFFSNGMFLNVVLLYFWLFEINIFIVQTLIWESKNHSEHFLLIKHSWY